MVAFQPYFQSGEETVRIARRAFFHSLCADDEIRSTFFPPLTRERAVQIATRHERIHGVPGHLLNIDCSHIVWKNCPKAWAGAHADKDKNVSIVLEAGCDYDLKFHHAFFGLPGSNNDIDVWNLSKFKTLMMAAGFATHIEPESPYFIGDEAFTVLWNTVDGIYPELARFVKTISVPDGSSEEEYVKWQESVRKAIERAFGVIQSKYRCLVRPVELHNPKEIHDMVIGCMILHNMMVDHRLSLGETESAERYQVCEGATSATLLERVAHIVEQNIVDDFLARKRLEQEIAEGGGATAAGSGPLPHHTCVAHTYTQARDRRRAVVDAQYDPLPTDDGEHLRLRKAIVQHLSNLKSRN